MASAGRVALAVLTLAACAREEAASAPAADPAPPFRPGLAPPSPEPPSPEPPPTEFCDTDGWCRPYAFLPFGSAAATTNAVAIASSELVALWADGQWLGAFSATHGTRVASVTRERDTLGIVTCVERRCERRDWSGDRFGPPFRVASAPKQTRARRLGEWRIEYSTLISPAGAKLRPRSELGQRSCATEFYLVGDEDSPFAVCRQYTSQSLHHVVNGELVTLVQPWATGWVNAGPAVHLGAGCEPCFATQDGLLVHHAGRWEIADMSIEALEAGTPRGPPYDGGGMTVPGVSIARDDQLQVGVGGKAWTWNGSGWERSRRDGPWAGRLQGFRWDEDTLAFATPDALYLVADGGSRLRYRRWERFLPAEAVETSFASVKGVAAADVLNARIGPHAAAALVAALPPDTRCVRLLDATSEVSGQKWQAIALADGRRGWANGRYLAADPSCPR